MVIGERIIIKDRCEALKELKETADNYKNYDWGIHSLPTTLLESIDIAIEVMEQTTWIPVSERLPDIHNYCMKYLVTDCHRHIHTSLFTESGGKSWWSYEDVIAWMPLPKPYEPQERSRNK